MKRFLITIISLLLLLAGYEYVVYYSDFYIDRPSDQTIEVPFRTEGTALCRQLEDDSYAPLTLRGVDITASMPGQYATAFAASEADYLRWLEAIGEMGANAVRVTTVMDDDFYNALYAYNTSHEQPLYLLQGTSVSDFAADNAKDAYDGEFMGRLLQDGRDLVDIIHGRKNIALNDLRGSGRYRRDVSPWVVGYVVGTEWVADTVAYTDHNIIRSGSYKGQYFSTTATAKPFEAMLAQVMDEITAYETVKYHTQRPIAALSQPDCDFLEYAPIYARQLGKYAYIDVQKILPSEAMHAGCFAAYRLYDFCDDFSRYLSEEQREEIAPLLQDLPQEEIYGGYLALLARYHKMPIVAAGYGFSSSRGAIKLGQEPRNEREQGEALLAVSQTLEADGWAGGFISTWQDHWERRTWNTAFAAVPTQNYRWHDLQTDGQNYGLLAFEPGEAGRVCVIDGDPKEWTEADVVMTAQGLTLSARYDAEGLYLLVQKAGLSPEETYYLPIDLSPEVGSAVCSDPVLHFERAADFLLVLSGRSETRLLVQKRYDAMRENFLFEVDGQDPFIIVPELKGEEFVPVTMALANPLILDELTPETRVQQRLGIWETGRLRHGSQIKDSKEYDSLADFCYGQDCVELRLPWLLLNVADPSEMQIHRDYYTHYGVETAKTSAVWLGVAPAGQTESISLSAYKLKGWGGRLKWQERLKDSYTVLQAAWKGDESLAADS